MFFFYSDHVFISKIRCLLNWPRFIYNANSLFVLTLTSGLCWWVVKPALKFEIVWLLYLHFNQVTNNNFSLMEKLYAILSCDRALKLSPVMEQSIYWPLKLRERRKWREGIMQLCYDFVESFPKAKHCKESQIVFCWFMSEIVNNGYRR